MRRVQKMLRIARRVTLTIMIGILSVHTIGCGSRDPENSVESKLQDHEFIEVYIELRRAAAEVDSGGDFTTMRDQILDRHGLTPADLRDFIESRSDDLQELSTLWDSIYQQLRRPVAEADRSTDR